MPRANFEPCDVYCRARRKPGGSSSPGQQQRGSTVEGEQYTEALLPWAAVADDDDVVTAGTTAGAGAGTSGSGPGFVDVGDEESGAGHNTANAGRAGGGGAGAGAGGASVGAGLLGSRLYRQAVWADLGDEGPAGLRRALAAEQSRGQTKGSGSTVSAGRAGSGAVEMRGQASGTLGRLGSGADVNGPTVDLNSPGADLIGPGAAPYRPSAVREGVDGGHASALEPIGSGRAGGEGDGLTSFGAPSPFQDASFSPAGPSGHVPVPGASLHGPPEAGGAWDHLSWKDKLRSFDWWWSVYEQVWGVSWL